MDHERRLTLNGAERQALADVGVIADDRGFLHSAGSGREVAPAVAVQLLKSGVPDPGDYQRGYLTYGHAADSPSVTGQRATVPMPEASPAYPQNYDRGWLAANHQAPSPGDSGPNNPHPPGSSAEDVLGSASETLASNVARLTGARVEPSVVPDAQAAPSAGHVHLPPDLRASSVPRVAQVQATKPAPGERP